MMTDMDEPQAYVPVAESARKVRKVLREAFPKSKISVTSPGEIRIEWEDSITDADGLQAVLTKAGLTQSDQWQRLTIDGWLLRLWCFNRAHREAAQREFERLRQAGEERRQREQEAIAEAHAVKQSVRASPIPFRRPDPPDPAVHEAFEQLREKAEAQVREHEGDRRPSWAPPLILGEELARACLELGWLTMDDKWIGRLWAMFASPKQSKRYVREHVSTLPLHGITCRGFQFFAGGERQLTSTMLFEAQRRMDGTWQFGPSFYPRDYTSPRARKWEELIRERERTQDEARVAAITSEIAAIDAEDAVDAEKYYQRQRLRQRARELAQARVLDFVGAPDAQMQAAGRLWGHCCRCGKALTDPLSLERGIGPDCYDGILCNIRAMAAEEYAVNRISWLIGMPVEFVIAVLSEPVAKPRHHPAPTPDLFDRAPAVATPETSDDDDWMIPGV